MSVIRGVAVDTDTSEPIGNTRIDIENDEDYRTSTDADGTFKVDVYAGKYEVSLHSRVYDNVELDITVGEDEEVDITLKSCKKRRYRK